MINNNFRLYDYWLISVNEEYAQEVLPGENEPPVGRIKMAIYPTSTGTQENILYDNCAYVGLTYDSEIDVKHIIRYGNERLKVAYIQPNLRFKQVYLKRVV